MNNLWGNIFKARKKEEDAIYDILKKVPVFDGLDRRALHRIERILHQREYRKDETIFHQGDPGLGMYIIERGIIEIISEPDRHQLAELHEGEFFGDLSLLDDSPRTATAIAKTPAKLLCFFQPDLLDLIQRNPRIGVKVLLRLAYVLGQRLRTTNNQMNELKQSYLPDASDVKSPAGSR